LDIQASMNVSSNPGFESFVGVFWDTHISSQGIS
jgi:hypothetical protein